MLKSLLILFSLLAGVWSLCLEECDRPEFCNDADVAAIPNNCTHYLFCLFNQWQVQECAEGTRFNISGPSDAKSCECVLEADDNTCPYVCPTEPETTIPPPGPCDDAEPCVNGTKYPDQANCSMYYECEGGSLEMQICQVGPAYGTCNNSGLLCVYDKDLEYCVHPDRDFSCENRCDNLKKNRGKEVKQKMCLRNGIVCNRPEYCTEGESLASPDSCTQFYSCVYGYWELYTCAAGSYFDNDVCECVSQVDCDWNCEETTPQPTMEPGPCSSAAVPCVDGDRVADKSNCEDFYECVDGEWQFRNCIGGTSDLCTEVGYACAFDVEQELCIHPNGAFTCDPRCPDDFEEMQKVEMPKKDLNFQSQVTCLGPDLVCNRPPYCNSSAQDHIANPDNCTTYFECENYEWTVRDCAPGAYYNADTCDCSDTTCTTPVPCSSTTPAPVIENGTCEDVGISCPEGELFADKSDCEFYYECRGGNLMRMRCGSPSFCPPDNEPGGACVFDIYTRKCTRPNAYFNCDLRCLTTGEPPGVTDDVTDDTSDDEDITGASDSPVTGRTTSTSGAGTTSPLYSTENPPEGPPGGDLEVWAIAVCSVVTVSGLVVMVILVIILVKKKNPSQVNPQQNDEYESDSESILSPKESIQMETNQA